MQSKKISNGSGAFLCALVLLTNAFSIMSGNAAGSAAWVSHIPATIVAVVCAAFFSGVCDAAPDKNFYGALEQAVGKLAAKIFGLILLGFVLITCVVSLTVFSRFVQITALPQTPQIIIPLIIIIIAALSLGSGLRSAAGSARLLFWFCAAVVILFAIPGIFGGSLSAVMPRGVENGKLLIGAAEVFINRFAQIPALMAIYTRMEEKETRKKFFLGSIAASGAVLAAISAITVSVLGAKHAAMDFYPVYTAMSVHSIGGFIQHTEIFACIAMTVCLFFKAATCLAFSEDVLSGVFETSGREGVAMPLALICGAATQIIYRDTSALRNMVEWKNAAWGFIAVEVMIPFVLIVFSKISRMRKRKTR